jgi:hypothetical protein
MLVCHVACAQYDCRSIYGSQLSCAFLQAAIVNKLQRLGEVRQQDYVGQMLWQQGTRATEYFSRWIELKEQLAGKA